MLHDGPIIMMRLRTRMKTNNTTRKIKNSALNSKEALLSRRGTT